MNTSYKNNLFSGLMTMDSGNMEMHTGASICAMAYLKKWSEPNSSTGDVIQIEIEK